MNNKKCQASKTITAVHTTYCGKEENHLGQDSFADGNGMFIWLDAYEVSNLKVLFGALAAAKAPVNNGDWFYQILHKLEQIYVPNNPPNDTVEALKDTILNWANRAIPKD